MNNVSWGSWLQKKKNWLIINKRRKWLVSFQTNSFEFFLLLLKNWKAIFNNGFHYQKFFFFFFFDEWNHLQLNERNVQNGLNKYSLQAKRNLSFDISFCVFFFFLCWMQSQNCNCVWTKRYKQTFWGKLIYQIKY